MFEILNFGHCGLIVICYLIFFSTETRHPKPQAVTYNMLSDKTRKGLRSQETSSMEFKSVDHVKTALEKADYICSKTIATVVFLAQATRKPVLVEGPAGVGQNRAFQGCRPEPGTRINPSSMLRRTG